MEVRLTVNESIGSPERCCTRRGFRVFCDRGFAALPPAPSVSTLPLDTNGGFYGPA